ncbi:acyltransferase [Proteus terrae]|uniref:acyltransferase family protein n=1 Tax=Proteus terrae TaxID=1574161 RepID=UPI0021BAE741|nr:acyltransferase [Proteus terrae]MCT8264707.1 acyltransferase [Proteus terrae]
MQDNKKRIYGLDLIRFIAAIMVVIFHYSYRGFQADNLTLMHIDDISMIGKYGHLGVQLFFMISGFVIMMSAHHGSVAKFFISRTSRLYPAFILCCTITFVVISFFNDNPSLSVSTKDYIINLSMLAGFVGVPSVDGVYWSLYVEIYFYFLVAVILICGQIKRAEYLLYLWMVFSLFAWYFDNGALKKLTISNYSIYFIAGGFLYYSWSAGFNLRRILSIIICCVISSLSAIQYNGYMRSYYNDNFSDMITVSIVVSFYLLMIFMIFFNIKWLSNPIFMKLGAATYPLYLLHQKIGYVVFDNLYGELNKYILFTFVIFFMVFISYIIGNKIEPAMTNLMKGFLTRIISPKRSDAVKE